MVRRAQSWNYHRRRIQVLALAASELIPPNSNVLDIGCGDGKIDRHILELRPDVRIQGCDLVSWPDQVIEVMINKGLPLPFESGSFDCALLIDVLHHSDDPSTLLKEAIRTSKEYAIVKDHLIDRWLTDPILQIMNRFRNESQGVSLSCTYWSKKQRLKDFRMNRFELDRWSTNIPI